MSEVVYKYGDVIWIVILKYIKIKELNSA
jgi:hypothetical protein